MAARVPQKRGRKTIVVNFEKKEFVKKKESEEPVVLVIPFSYSEIKRFNTNFMDTDTQIILQQKPVKFQCEILEEKKIPDEDVSEEKKAPDTFTSITKKGALLETIIYNVNLIPTEISSLNFEELKKIKTDISCWWCCHQFDTFPLCAPLKYDHKKNIFKVKGCFCSFNCIKSYSYTDKSLKEPSLINFLHKTLTGSVLHIKKAPPKEILVKFGGCVSIEEYRESFKSIKNYSINNHPMIFNPMQIEESKEIELLEESVKTLASVKTKKIVLNRSTFKESLKRQTLAKPKYAGNTLSKLMGIRTLS